MNPVERIGISDLERRLGVSRRTVARWVRTGYFPAPHRVGSIKDRKWTVAEVAAWERENIRVAA